MPIKKLLSWLLPYTCILCGFESDRGQDLCSYCYKDISIPPYACQQCAAALPISHPICGTCLKKPPPFDKTYALFSYETPIDKLLLELKFNQALINARILGELMAEKISTDWYNNKQLPDIVIPIPLHFSRLKERGYNQAVEIARPIIKHLNLRLDLYSCQRIKATTPQAMLPANQRKNNISKAFTTQKRFDGYFIAVIDDVITTGNTIREFCELLKQQGAARIDVWCCARPSI